MLRYQMAEEPDLPGRVEALEALERACGGAPGEPGCSDLLEALEERVATDSSRLVRQLAARALERLAPKATAPGARE